jgi:hypothetical protein
MTDSGARSIHPHRNERSVKWMQYGAKRYLTEDGRWGAEINGMDIQIAANLVAEAIGIPDPYWRTDWTPLAGWLYAGLDLHDVVLPAIRQAVARGAAQGKTYLPYFDRIVRSFVPGQRHNGRRWA